LLPRPRDPADRERERREPEGDSVRDVGLPRGLVREECVDGARGREDGSNPWGAGDGQEEGYEEEVGEEEGGEAERGEAPRDDAVGGEGA